MRIVKKLKRSEAGVTLIETIVALAILGCAGVGFLWALATDSKATIIANEQSTAESLVHSEIEVWDDSPYTIIATAKDTSNNTVTTIRAGVWNSNLEISCWQVNP